MPKTPSTLLLPVLAFVLHALLGPESRATVLDLICPGTVDTELVEALGKPIVTERIEDLKVSTWSRPEAGIAGATTWSEPDGTVRWARIRLVNELPPMAAQLLFDLIGGETATEGHALAATEQSEGLTHHYAADGVHFFTTDNIVREIWRTPPRADLASIRTAAEASWPWELPTAAPAGQANPSGSNQVIGTPLSGQLLSISNLETGVVKIAEDYMFILKGRVQAAGFQGEEITISGRIYEEDSVTPLKAGPDGPVEFRAPDGHLQVTQVHTVQHSFASWDGLVLLFPLKHIVKSGDLFRTYVFELEASCGDKAVFGSKELHLRRDDAPAVRPSREIRLHASPLVEESVQEETGPGILVQLPVEVIGCTGSDLRINLFLGHQDGPLVQASPGWDDWRDSAGIFYALGITHVLYDHSNWNPYKIWVPYAALDLPAGEHTLKIRVVAFCENVSAALEFDTTIVKP